jgi:hypothetical protein
VSAIQTIAKLEALLARVRSRVAEPRPARGVGAAPGAAHLPLPDELLDEEPDQPTLPPPPVAASPAAAAPYAPAPARTPPPAAPALELSVDVDVSVEEPVAREPAPAEPAAVSDAVGSRERMVAAEPVRREALPSELFEPAAEAPPAAPPPSADEEVEEPPVSSRRPLAPQPEERLAEMAFGAEEPRPPLHTPPPESGRLPAAPALEFVEEDTGIRAAVVPPPAVVAETTRAELTGAGRAAAMHGAVPSFKPATFAELLDATLAL